MNQNSKDDIIKAHIFCRTNKKILENSNLCGCFFCLQIFDPKEINDWCDNGTTAICPYCGIDSIIPQNTDYLITHEFLTEMKKHWFF